jgi:hypothetical protein
MVTSADEGKHGSATKAEGAGEGATKAEGAGEGAAPGAEDAMGGFLIEPGQYAGMVPEAPMTFDRVFLSQQGQSGW